MGLFDGIRDKISGMLGGEPNPDERPEELKVQEKIQTMWTDSKGQPIYSDDLVAEMNKYHAAKRTERLYHELQWRLDMNMKEGNQYVEINMQTMRIEETPRLNWYQEMEALNHIAPIIETRLAKLKRLNLTFKTRPSSNDSEDIAKARISNKVLEGIVQDKKVSLLQNTANAWAETIGSAIWCSYWDPRAGKLVGIIEDEETGKQEKIYEGDMAVEVATPFEFFLNSLWIQELSEQPNLMRVRPMPVTLIEQIYDIRLPEGNEVEIYSLSSSSYSQGGGYQKSGSAIFGTRKLADSAIVMEFYEKPTPLYPRGRMVICTDTVLLQAGDLPYRIGEAGELDYPFEMQKCIEVEGQAWGKSIVSRLIPVQRRYNAIKNRKAEYLTRCTIGNLYYEAGSIDADQFDVEGLAPGDMIELRPGTTIPPGFLTFPPLPSTFTEEEQSYLNLFVVISGVSEVSRDSNAPTGVSSGTALQILQEQDDTRVSLTGENIKLTMLANAKKWIRLNRQYALTDRMVKSVGRDSRQDIIEWKGSDLTSDDIYLESISLLSETLAQRRQMVFDLLNTGLMNDPDTGVISKDGRAKVFELIELGDWENFNESDNSNLHFERAQRENRQMLQGEDVRIMEFDDDILHINRHNSYRLSSEYDELMEKDPDLAMLIDSHVAEHVASLQQKAVEAAGPMQPLGGAPDAQPTLPNEPATVQSMGA